MSVHTQTSSPETIQSVLGSKARKRDWRKREVAVAFVFLAPWLIGLIGLTLGPMLYSLYLSFTDYNLLSSPKWVGLQNFVTMFTSDERFWVSTRVTIVYVIFGVPLILIVSLMIAALLNSKIAFLSGYRALFYLPSLMGASVAIAALWRQIFGGNGLINQILSYFGIEAGSWVGNPDTALGTLVVLALWAFGSTMIIFLAGLRQIPAELYEAAAVDGAGRVRRFLNITLPMLTPIIFFNALMVTINAFQAFTPAYVISGGTGGPVNSTLFYTLYLYQQGFAQLNMGYASAMAWLLVAVLAIFSGLFFWSSRYWVYYGDK
ncbi:carbohydrate ABC transporter permease [Microbacterium sp. MPKO10]|uniref:carbohydrate ABC transporter permease n=1 Tax=Microbacterium sp. MPKO10 TaxID=2989818 RepID=UPI0022365003|nr:sugar ABC transporter permease [Microbacterium sp. MPKO10]MCW4458664.1 sugar ABC transporter permease [Microbacterium sp. MPKO10]